MASVPGNQSQQDEDSEEARALSEQVVQGVLESDSDEDAGGGLIQQMGELGERPPSPWASHFGLRGHEPSYHSAEHTWIAPREPPVTPSGAGNPSPPNDYAAKPNLKPSEYDDLFLTERLQISRFKGLRTREAQLFSQLDSYQPLKDAKTWSENLFEGRQIRVDETNHLNLFRKNRWLLLDRPIRHTIEKINGKPIASRTGWNVHYKPLWDELSVCIELADRILKHSFKGPWMQTFLSDGGMFEALQQPMGAGVTRAIHKFQPRIKPQFISTAAAPTTAPQAAPSWKPNPMASSFDPSTAKGASEKIVEGDDSADPLTGFLDPAQLQRLDKEMAEQTIKDQKAREQAAKELAEMLEERKQREIEAAKKADCLARGVKYVSPEELEAIKEAEAEAVKKAEAEARGEKYVSEADKKKKQKKWYPPPRPKPEPPKPGPEGFIFEPDWIDAELQCYRSIDLMKNRIYWTFFDEKFTDPRPEECRGRGLHYTKGFFGDMDYGVVALSIEAILPLLDEQSTPMERVLAIHMLAITMIRAVLELLQKSYQYNNGIGGMSYGNEGVSDLASSFENAVFGGKINFPFHQDSAASRQKGNALILTGSDFPTAGDFGLPWFPDFEKEFWYQTANAAGALGPEAPYRKNWLSYAIPGTWSVNLLLESFWVDQVQKFSRGTLQFPKHFRAREHRDDDAFGSHHLETRTYSAKFEPPFPPQASMGSLNQQLVAKQKETAALRPWYWEAYYRWQITPYSMASTRWYLNQMSRWLMTLSEWDEFRIQELNKLWLFKTPSFNGAPLAWFYSAMADLISASLPTRDVARYVDGLVRDPNQDDALIYLKGLPGITSQAVRQVRALLADGCSERRPFCLLARSRELRLKHVIRAWNKFEFFFQGRTHQTGLKDSFQAMVRHLWNHVNDPTTAQQRWRFTLPEYTDQLAGTNWEHPGTKQGISQANRKPDTSRFIEIGPIKLRPAMLAQFAASVADADERYMYELPRNLMLSDVDLKIDTPRPRPGDPVGRMRMARQDVDGPTLRHYTIAECADHARLDSLWVLGDEGDDIVIYDITEGCRRMKWTLKMVENITKRGDYGFHLIGDDIHRHAPMMWSKKVGYVLQWKHESDVVENDGQDGRPFWITIGLDVFDLTGKLSYIPFGNDRLEAALKSNPGGNPTSAIYADKTLRNDFTLFVDQLMPWRCGRLRQHAVPSVTDLLFTREEVAWYQFIKTGMYIVLYGSVYDMTEYCQFHPGGLRSLFETSGKDNTKVFEYFHSKNGKEILEEYQHLRIGHIIEERPFDAPLAADEIEVQNYIYKIPADRHEWKDCFGGRIITDKLLKKKGLYRRPGSKELENITFGAIWSGDLCLALTHSKYCIARRRVTADKPLRVIKAADLAKCNGHEGAGWYNEGWAAYDGDVYNLTTVGLYAPLGLAEMVRPYLGKIIAYRDLGEMIKKKFSFRIVGKLEERGARFLPQRELEELNLDAELTNKPKWGLRGDLPPEYNIHDVEMTDIEVNTNPRNAVAAAEREHPDATATSSSPTPRLMRRGPTSPSIEPLAPPISN
ncbi:hypothetical protein G7046_g9696 [Stylonectria norvegica]|nr:hypothetical protein G7046_g9696 [Stylonectria norvegica]